MPTFKQQWVVYHPRSSDAQVFPTVAEAEAYRAERAGADEYVVAPISQFRVLKRVAYSSGGETLLINDGVSFWVTDGDGHLDPWTYGPFPTLDIALGRFNEVLDDLNRSGVVGEIIK